MKRASTRFLVLLIVGVSLGGAGWRTDPIYNVRSDSMATSDGVTLEDVTRAIQRAGGGLGWQMIEIEPGKLEGRLRIRSHLAIVNIPFDTKTFSILYKRSINLKYDGTSIHQNYNSWVQNLEQAILAETSKM